MSRSKEVCITRLRFGKCKLNKCLPVIKRHPDGLCPSCGRDDTVEHLLLECNRFNMAITIADKCNELHIQPTTKNILGDGRLTDVIFGVLSANDVIV